MHVFGGGVLVAHPLPFHPVPAAASERQQRSEAVLQALAAAAEALQSWEFVRQHGAWAEAHQQQLPAAVLDFWRQAQQVRWLAQEGASWRGPNLVVAPQYLWLPVSPALPVGAPQVDEARHRSAQAAARELQAAMRAALADGYIFLLPTTPGPAPAEPAGTSEQGSSEVAAFAARCRQFAAVAALSGVPQVTLPLPQPGGMPLSVSLLALHKRDQALLHAAAKLGPMLAEEAAALAERQRQERRRRGKGSSDGEQPQRWQPQADVAATAAAGRGAAAGAAKRANGGRRAKPQDEAAAAAEAAAEARKEDGNATFRAGRYDEAVRHYSAAMQLHPRGAVYRANRAMAYLKLGAYSAAEADCDEALALELSAKTLLRRASARLAQVRLAVVSSWACRCPHLP